MPERPRCSSLASQTAPKASGEPNARGRPATRQNRSKLEKRFGRAPIFQTGDRLVLLGGSAGVIGIRRSSVAGSAKSGSRS